MRFLRLLLILTAAPSLSPLFAAPAKEPAIISLGADGRLVYDRDARGNRVPDFSHCGYAGGDRAIPDVPVRIVVAAAEGDSTARIQKAIDYVGNLVPDGTGFRGTVLLLKGRHEVSGSLRLNQSGVILRGQGMDANGTLLVATGQDRRTLIQIAGKADYAIMSNQQREILDPYVPVGATQLRVSNAGNLKPGDTIQITRPSSAQWIEQLGMRRFGGGIEDGRLAWKPGSRDLVWDRTIEKIEGDKVTIDAPITTAIDADLGRGRVTPYVWPGRISNVGIENLSCISSRDEKNAKDENHAWNALSIEHAQDAWVRRLTGMYFAGSLVAVGQSAKRVTVQNCLSLAPVSEEGGYRRHTFFTMGQQTLFLHCWAEEGRHDFSVGYCAAGPNAFVQCEAIYALQDSGPIESWASGVLYDNVQIEGNALSLANRGISAQGAGWSAANSVLWQCSAAVLRCVNPPGAQNWAFGCWGAFEGDGIWRQSNEFIRPDSLYAAQLADRLGKDAVARLNLLTRSRREATNPSLEEAARWVAAAREPAASLVEHIAAADKRPLAAEPSNAKRVEELEKPVAASGRDTKPILITNGWITCQNRLVVGSRRGVTWWRGTIRPTEAFLFGAALTRFVPGRFGQGLTDELPAVAADMLTNGVAALDHNYGLWYDRRRDDHQRVRRLDGDVWPPFFEQPFARSGRGLAWDGLSQYDLRQYNPWYWKRLKDFAEICDREGLLLFHQNYFQHNLLEAGAHWADSPWRTANNINETGFPEPPPYAGDKRIFMAEPFYDVAHQTRRKLHRAYIRQCLDAFASHSNVLQFTSAEYTGPRQFVEFWLDTISEWQREKGRDPLVALSCTKDVQDAILEDQSRNRLIDVIDLKYWWITEHGEFAPKGGLSLSPRQFERQWKGGRPNDEDLARMTSDYRTRFPAAAVICDFSAGSWAFLCAGGSIPNLPPTTDRSLLAAIPRMQPWTEASNRERWVLREPGQQYLVYRSAPASSDFKLVENSGWVLQQIDLSTGKVLGDRAIVSGELVKLPGSNGPAVFWLTRKL